MPVDKFGRISELKTSGDGDGVSLAYIGNNFLRRDGTTPATGSINMAGNTLTLVSNPVNPQDVATKSYVDGAGGLLDENGGYIMKGYLNMGFNKIRNIRKPEEESEAANKFYVDNGGAIVKNSDGSFSAIADINMQEHTLTDVKNPIEPQDVANKIYVDTVVNKVTAGDRALTKNHAGSFLAAVNIVMNGNSITGLPNPTDRDAAANKNYVDNGGAIVKYPNGSFSAIADINMRGFSIKHAGAPVEERDLATKSYVDKKVLPVISVCAEEEGSLKDGEYEFSFGNGSAGISHGVGGYCMAAPGRIIRGTLMVARDRSTLKEEAKVNIVVNGVEQVDYTIVKKKGEGCSCVVFPQPLVVDQCDAINFITRSNNKNAQKAYVSILIELDL